MTRTSKNQKPKLLSETLGGSELVLPRHRPQITIETAINRVSQNHWVAHRIAETMLHQLSQFQRPLPFIKISEGFVWQETGRIKAINLFYIKR